MAHVADALDSMLQWIGEGRHSISRFAFVCFGPQTFPTHECPCGWRGTFEQALKHAEKTDADWPAYS